MKGGALPLLCWALLLAAAGALNAIWAGVSIQTATFGAAVMVILIIAGAVLARPRRSTPEAITHASFATMILALGFAVLMFGLTFGHFLIYLGIGMMVTASGRLLIEFHHQRRAVQGSRR